MISWWLNDPAGADRRGVEHNRARLLMTLKKVGIIAMAAHTLLAVSHAPLRRPPTNGQALEWLSERGECWMCCLIDIEALVYRRQGDLHLFTAAAPPSSLISSPLRPPPPPSSSRSHAATQSSLFLPSLCEVDITPPCRWDIDQPSPPPPSPFSPQATPLILPLPHPHPEPAS